MKKLILYIACSLDGYIATPEHSVEWLERLENPDGNDYGYKAFMERIDTVIMGRKTYEVVQNMGVEWPYKECESLVISREKNLEISTPNTRLLQGDLFEALEKIKNVWSEKHIWLIGGGLTARSLLEYQCVDEVMLFTAPIILGEGIRLFPPSKKITKLKLLEQWAYPSGMLYAHYEINKQ